MSQLEVALVTGGSSGMGLATAEKLYSLGINVVIVGRREDKLIEAIDHIKSAVADAKAEISYVSADVGVWEDVEKIYHFVDEKYGRIDLIVNAAGAIITLQNIEDNSVDEINKSISVNLMGPIYICKAFTPMLKAQKSGTIVNISSVCGKLAWPKFSVYTAAKFGISGFSKCLSTELRPFGIRVTCLFPAACETNFSVAGGLGPQKFDLQPTHIAQAIINLYQLPKRVFVEEQTVWGMDQECIPL